MFTSNFCNSVLMERLIRTHWKWWILGASLGLLSSPGYPQRICVKSQEKHQNSNLVAGFCMFLVWINLVAGFCSMLSRSFKTFVEARGSSTFVSRCTLRSRTTTWASQGWRRRPRCCFLSVKHQAWRFISIQNMWICTLWYTNVPLKTLVKHTYFPG